MQSRTITTITTDHFEWDAKDEKWTPVHRIETTETTTSGDDS